MHGSAVASLVCSLQNSSSACQETGLLQSLRYSNFYEEKKPGLGDIIFLIFFFFPQTHIVFSQGTVPVPETLLAQKLGTVFFSLGHCSILLLIIR